MVHEHVGVVRCAAENWKSADMVDCILCFAATELVDKMTSPNDPDGRAMLERVNAVRSWSLRSTPVLPAAHRLATWRPWP
jgi:hypothetical protein